MNARVWCVLALATAALGLSGCGERAQTQGSWSAAKRDAALYTGGSPSSFTQGGWKAGDRDAWASQLKARAQYGQNDHQRVVTP